MAPDRSFSLRTHSFWPVSCLRPPLASDTPWVALCYSSVTRLAFGPLPPPGTTPVLYPAHPLALELVCSRGPFGYQLTPHLPLTIATVTPPLTPELQSYPLSRLRSYQLSFGLPVFTGLLVSSWALVPAFIPSPVTLTLLTIPIPVRPALPALYLRF
ncbi:hypothetical protein M404DRAFT_23414 [Pisolithus tinctorius Marx 270]|uniref:Uncharacterized protein n=1 Tax=Pisolithus tinctorius Marx 270 TaxID=870435 RepID=A0A0C3KEX1_PISTI|nr:hypothetical protein M404DRAFT_23414 [Pisolithus tinctorius Marx 270]